jgi:predicted MFS family arabinose efflux permease
VAPATLLAPLLGGWLADSLGYGVTFATAAVGGFMAWLILRMFVRDARQRTPKAQPAPLAAGAE